MAEDGGAEKGFLADAALGRLARYMRMLGYDVAYARNRGGAEVLRETLILGEGEELFAPEEECRPFCIEELAREKEAPQSEVIAH